MQATLFLLLCCIPIASFAQTYGEESARRIRAAERIEPVVDATFGEQLSLYNGTVKFRTVDVSIPSSSGPSVEFVRLLGGDDQSQNFWGFDVDVPKVTTLMPAGWQGGWTSSPPSPYGDFLKKDYWPGFTLRVNGDTTKLLYRGSDARIQIPNGGGDFRFMTKANWALQVVPAPSGVGEALIGHAPDGSKYYFDHLVAGPYYDRVEHRTKFDVTTYAPLSLERRQLVLFVSKIEDRFGNWVKYEWVGARLARIYASDGREIVITSEKVMPTVGENVDNRYMVRRVEAQGRAWQYNNIGREVINPDLSTWVYEGSFDSAISYVRTIYTQNGSISAQYDFALCAKAFDFVAGQSKTLKVKHPSGATAVYQLYPMRHGRTNVPYTCRQMSDDPATWNGVFSIYDDVWTLVKRTVSGPGLPVLETTYQYSDAYGYDPTSSTEVAGDPAPPNYKTVTVIGPDGHYKNLIFGLDWGLTEGFLMSVRDHSAQGLLLRQTDNTYLTKQQVASEPFPLSYGSDGVAPSDGLSAWNLPLRSAVITQDGRKFSSYVNSYDPFARPASITKSSAPAP